MEEVDNDYFPSQVDPPPPSNNNNNNNATDNKGRGGAKGPSSSLSNNTSTNISSSSNSSSGANSTRHHNTSTLNETTDSVPRSSSSAESPSPLVERSDTVAGSGAETLSPSSLPPSSGSSAEVPSSSRSVGHTDPPAPSLFPPPPPPVTTERSSSTLVDMKEEELMKVPVPNTITSIGVDEGCASHTEPAAGGRCLVDGSTVHQEGGDRAVDSALSAAKDEVSVDTPNSEVPTLGADGISSFLSKSTPTGDDPPLSFWDLVLQISQSQHAAAFTLSGKVIQSFAALGGTLHQAALALIPESLDPTEWGERLEWSPLALLFSPESTPSSQVPSWLSSEFLWNVVETHTAECVMVAVCVVLFALKCLISFRYRKFRSILSDIALQQQRRQQEASSSSSGGLSEAMRGGGVQKAMRTGGLKEKRSLSLNQL